MTPQLPSETKLAACPFCGTGAVTTDKNRAAIEHSKDCYMRRYIGSSQIWLSLDAEAWNRRTPSPANAEAGDDCTCERVQMSENGQRLNCPDCGRVYKRNTRPYGRGWQIAPRIGPTDPDNAEAGDVAELIALVERTPLRAVDEAKLITALRSLAAVRAERDAAIVLRDTAVRSTAEIYESREKIMAKRDALARENERLREALDSIGEVVVQRLRPEQKIAGIAEIAEAALAPVSP